MQGFRSFFLENYSASKIGLETDIRNLENYFGSRAPYGFWIDRHGNWKKVGMQNHANVAMDMLNAMGTGGSEIGVYSEMFKRGFIRVVMGHGSIFYELPKDKQPSMSQLKVLRHMKDLWGKSDIIRESKKMVVEGYHASDLGMEIEEDEEE